MMIAEFSDLWQDAPVSGIADPEEHLAAIRRERESKLSNSSAAARITNSIHWFKWAEVETWIQQADDLKGLEIEGLPCLFFFAKKGLLPLCQVFLDNGGDVNGQYLTPILGESTQGVTAIQYVASELPLELKAEVYNFLLANNADSTVKNGNQLSAQDYARRSGLIEFNGRLMNMDQVQSELRTLELTEKLAERVGRKPTREECQLLTSGLLELQEEDAKELYETLKERFRQPLPWALKNEKIETSLVYSASDAVLVFESIFGPFLDAPVLAKRSLKI